MKRLFLLLVLFASLQLSASERSLNEIQTIARQRLSHSAAVKKLKGKRAALEVQCIAENKAFAVFEPECSGAFVIISKSDLTQPVIGYSESAYQLEQMPPAMQWFLKSVEQNIMEAEANGRVLTNKSAAYVPVAPFVTTQWHQSSPFNDLVPKQYPAGCGAISLAQCINYCKYPSKVDFRGYYAYLPSSSSTRYTVDSLDIKSLYLYPFLDNYGRASSAQKKGVATLVRDCGYSEFMLYGPNGSSTVNLYGAIALVESFQYPEACVKYMQSSFYPKDKWSELIYSELMKKSPVIMGGHDEKEGGHAFVLCGIDADGLVYVNWGWGAQSDGFYAIELMNPDGDSYSLYQDIIYGIRSTPLDTDVRRPRWFSTDGEPYTFELVMEEDGTGKSRPTLNIAFNAGLENSTPTTLKGECGLFGQDLTTGEFWQITETDPVHWGCGAYLELKEPSTMYYYYLDDDLIPGHTYRISFGTRDEVENEWHSVLCYGGEIAYDVYYTGDIKTSTISEVMNITPVDAIHAPLVNNESQPTRLYGYYDLSGRHYDSKPSKSGLYIKDGQKILIR